MPVSLLVLAVFFVFTSFAFGCMEPWSIATAEVMLFVGAGLTGLADREFWHWPRKLGPFAVFVVTLAALCVLQLVPLPVSFWKSVDSGRISVYEDGRRSEDLLQSDNYRKDPFEGTEAAQEKFSYTPQVPSMLPLSRAPLSTFRGLVVLLAFLCFILLLEHVAASGSAYLRKLSLVVGLAGLTVGLMALTEKGIERRTHIMGIRESQRASIAFGPFINGNHGEAFINLTFPILCYLLWRSSKNTKKISDKIGLRILAFSLLALQGALVISGSSRGNFLCLALLPVMFLLHKGLFNKSGPALACAAALIAVTVASVWFLSYSGLLTNEVRVAMNGNIEPAAMVVGNGIGGFEEVFPSVIKDWPLFKSMHNAFLENEYLQLYFEAGVIAVPLLLMLLAAVAVHGYRGLARKGSSFWLISPVVAETIRAWVDMSFHVLPLASVFLLLFVMVANREGHS